MSLDPRSPSMNLWHRLLAAGVSEEEATALMHGYAHELAERQRASGRDQRCTGVDCCGEHGGVADLIDPWAQQPRVDEYRLSTR